jgi:hypothetical protein
MIDAHDVSGSPGEGNVIGRRGRRGALVFGLATIAAYLLQFIAWSLHPGSIADPNAGVSPRWWSAASFPLFWIVADRTASALFEAMLVANSLLWGAATWIVLTRASSRGGTSDRSHG